MSLILIRHTRPAVGRDVCYGRTDVDLDDNFEQEARRIATSLGRIDVLATSPLSRCRRLAELIGQTHGVEPSIDPRLQEMDFGRWEGRKWSDIPRDQLDAWAGDFFSARPHGGESVAMVRDRAIQAVRAYRDLEQRCVLVTHAGFIRVVLADGDEPESFNTKIGYGECIPWPRNTETDDE
ncbi:MAG: alpha-ribazole phosphatase [Pseudomonadota bacterium]